MQERNNETRPGLKCAPTRRPDELIAAAPLRMTFRAPGRFWQADARKMKLDAGAYDLILDKVRNSSDLFHPGPAYLSLVPSASPRPLPSLLTPPHTHTGPHRLAHVRGQLPRGDREHVRRRLQGAQRQRILRRDDVRPSGGPCSPPEERRLWVGGTWWRCACDCRCVRSSRVREFLRACVRRRKRQNGICGLLSCPPQVEVFCLRKPNPDVTEQVRAAHRFPLSSPLPGHHHKAAPESSSNRLPSQEIHEPVPWWGGEGVEKADGGHGVHYLYLMRKKHGESSSSAARPPPVGSSAGAAAVPPPPGTTEEDGASKNGDRRTSAATTSTTGPEAAAAVGELSSQH